MSHRLRWIGLMVLASVLLVGVIGAAPSRPARAGAATFTVTAHSAFLRDTPQAGATPTYSVFGGQSYNILGRTSNSAWVRLDMAGASKGTWILASFGTIAGSLAAVPAEAGAASAPAPTAVPAAGGNTGPASGPAAAPAAAGSQRLTITAASTYARAAPSWSATKLASLFKGQSYTATGRDASSQWLQVQLPGEAWVSVGVGVLSGHLSSLPVVGPAPVAGQPAPAATLQPGELPAWIPVLTPHMRDVYNSAAKRGLDPASFSVAGDCNSEGNIYTQLIAFDLIDLTNTPYLRSTARYFKGNTFRKSMAVAGGFSAATIMDPIWAFPEFCTSDEGPFACELRISKSSVVFILLGTGDHFQWQSFEANYRAPIEYALKAGVLPVLVTKVDALEWEEAGAPKGYINDVIRRLGAEYDVPVIDLWQATRDVRGGGLTDEPGHDFHLNAEAIGIHVISTLQMLYRLTN